MFKKLRFYAILLLILNSIALMVMFIITCAKRRHICWAFLAASIVEAASGGYLMANLHHEVKQERRAEAYLDATFEEIEGDDWGAAEATVN